MQVRYAIRVDAHRLGEARSLAYHREVARRLRREPERIEVARERVQDWLRTGEPDARYARAWSEILDRSIEEIAAFLVEETETARALRQVTPFAGFLSARERWRIWREVRASLEAPK
jgi:hypothetical protein